MLRLNSIEKIEANQVFQTGCKPVLVHADDLNFYVCKYLIGNTSADKLFREFLAVSFLKSWKIAVPDCNLVFIKPEHLPAGIGISEINLNCPCFGSLFNRKYKEIDKFLNQLSEYQSQRFINPEEFLDIAFFDIWVGNDDRHPGNYNLFIFDENGKQHFMAYDHEAIFNTGNLHRGLYTINIEDSILSSPFIFQIFSAKDLKNKEYLQSLKKKWYLCSQKCKESLPQVLDNVPDEWKINKNQQGKLLNQYLFDDKWFEESFRVFLEILQVNLNKKE